MGLTATCNECGYFYEVDGKQISAINTFQGELLEAAGYELPSGARGSAMGCIVNVMSTGTGVLSPTRVKVANLRPGDDLKITVNPTTNAFVLDKIKMKPRAPEIEPAVDQPSFDDDC
jgi:hypothetical protein